ncbi:MAG TPA: hypothetical protein VH370_11505 [Humisphaera sp.]|nr:hypothetical protein [Humisphaera sp.]
MALSNRERYIGIGVGAVLGILVLDYMIIEPILSHRRSQQLLITNARKTLDDMAHDKQINTHLQAQWKRMKDGGMKTTPSEAFDQLDRAMHDWALQSGVVPGDSRRSPSGPEKIHDQMYQKSKVHFVGTGNLRAVSTMLWSIETTVLPIHIDDMVITAVREGEDNLKVEFSVSVMVPLGDQGPAQPAAPTVADARGAQS